ncbi:hypothetical protein [Dictyobacter kobayashii]|nr:hypothetical protein [Dictyobacter kobayashii]
MRSLSLSTTQTLRWSQPNPFKCYHELVGGNEAFVVLQQSGIFTTRHAIEAGDQRWTIETVDFWQNLVIVSNGWTGEEVARFKKKYCGDVDLWFKDGRHFTWTGPWWSYNRLWIDGEGHPLLHVENCGKDMGIVPAAFTLPELPLLCGLGRYLSVLQQSMTMMAIIISVFATTTSANHHM